MEGRLFNGRVFSADLITPALVTGYWTEYRRLVAQMDQHDLFEEIGVRALSVNGIVLGPDGVVVGRRPAGAMYQPGQWQLAPAGGVDGRSARPDGSVDVLYAVYSELREEVGLQANAVHHPCPLAIVEHGGSHLLDLGIVLRTELTAAEIRAAHATAEDDEYAALEMIPPVALPRFIADAGASLTAQMPMFLTRMGFLSRRAAVDMPMTGN